MNMNRQLTISILAALALPTASLRAQTPADHAKHDQHKLYSPSEIEWKEGPPSLPPGAGVARHLGVPKAEGPFVMRLRLPSGYHIPPHTHPQVERVTVISGTFHLAMGDQLERSKAQTLTAGSFGFWPAGMKHTGWAEGETILQVHGVGPWIINYLNTADDPRNAKK